MTYLLAYACCLPVAMFFACCLGAAAKRADDVDERIHRVMRGK